MNNLVSIIVPCYNQAQYLDECLNSVLSQTYPNWECIIVNDGSPDNSEEIANNWCKNDKRFKYLKKQNGGLSSARNAGINISEGEYILPLDADDYIDPTFLSKSVKVLESDLNIKAVGTWVNFFGDITGIHPSTGGSIIDLLHKNVTVATTLFRISDFINVGAYDETFTEGYEDWELWIRLLKDGGLINILPEPLFFYRKKNSSMLVDVSKNHNIVYKKIILKHIDLFHKYFIDLLLLKENELKDLISDNQKLVKIAKVYANNRFIKIFYQIRNFFFNRSL